MTLAARPLRTHQRQVFGLMAALAAGEATGITDVLAAVTPGGGKSLLPVIAGAHLIRAGIVERICWVVPRDSLRLQAEEAFADPYWRGALNHNLTVRTRLSPGSGQARSRRFGDAREPSGTRALTFPAVISSGWGHRHN